MVSYEQCERTTLGWWAFDPILIPVPLSLMERAWQPLKRLVGRDPFARVKGTFL